MTSRNSSSLENDASPAYAALPDDKNCCAGLAARPRNLADRAVSNLILRLDPSVYAALATWLVKVPAPFCDEVVPADEVVELVAVVEVVGVVVDGVAVVEDWVVAEVIPLEYAGRVSAIELCIGIPKIVGQKLFATIERFVGCALSLGRRRL